MELEDMKTQWEAMSQRVAALELINDKKIMEITQLKYKNSFSKLTNYERGGAVICYLIGLFVLFNVTKLDTWYLLLCGVLVMAFLFILPFYSLKALRDISNLSVSKYNYKEMLQRYEILKKRTVSFQKKGVIASFVMLFVSIPVADRILNGNDFFLNEIKSSFWGAIVFGVVVVIFASKWGVGWYKKITNRAGSILKDLEEE